MNIFSIILRIGGTIALTTTNFFVFNQPINATNSCSSNNSGDAICSKNSLLKNGVQLSQKTGGLFIEMKGCTRSDETDVICEFTVINKGSRRSLDISTYFSKMIDSNGKSYQALYATLASHGGVLSASLDEAETDISYAASLTFKNVPQQINKAQLLVVSARLGFNTYNGKFRNISFSS
jgi:hypothetical protein